MNLEFKNCSKKFKNNIILDKVNFNIEAGIFRLTGVNGAGKSTLLRMIANLDKKYIGEIRANKLSLLYLTIEPIGIIPFTIKENLEILWQTFSLSPTEKRLSQVKAFFANNFRYSIW